MGFKREGERGLGHRKMKQSRDALQGPARSDGCDQRFTEAVGKIIKKRPEQDSRFQPEPQIKRIQSSAMG